MINNDGFSEPVYVTEPLLPDLAETYSMLEIIWQSRQLSNNGKMAQELERKLAAFLGTRYLSVFANGTNALQIACKTLDLSGEVITTPFTFAATANALAWNHLTPVFCDIEEATFNIDADRIESLITNKTTAILPVHVFGHPCEVEKIDRIAARHNLKVLYDGAHAFGVKIKDKPIGAYGDITMFSFHATKIFHTVEGGALIFRDQDLQQKAKCLRNFGLKEDYSVDEPGINGKLNELQAAVGILLLKEVEAEITQRKYLTNLYRQVLVDVPGITVSQEAEEITANYPYFVIRVDPAAYGISRDELYSRLLSFNIFCRKYFYPLCSNFKCFKGLPSSSADNLPTANKVAESVLALPLHGRMSASDVQKIGGIIREIKIKSKSTKFSIELGV